MSHTTEELYDVYQVTVRRARVPHHCSACGLQIAPGERYAYVGIIFNGTVENVKRCGRCQKIHEHLQRKGDGHTWPDERLRCGLDYASEWGGDPPVEIQAVLFMTSDEASAMMVPRARHDMMNNPWPITFEAVS